MISVVSSIRDQRLLRVVLAFQYLCTFYAHAQVNERATDVTLAAWHGIRLHWLVGTMQIRLSLLLPARSAAAFGASCVSTFSSNPCWMDFAWQRR